ncbi:MAG: Coenzyme F420 hydrogenase/dehydrogenase, beta subunit C-terminal domain [Phenylobacterium sp.]|nr:Coenzyme F420 hydrogenase/dehydrogenase, beta subunit C-terminal domain [Phenylobacterium sp.]
MAGPAIRMEQPAPGYARPAQSGGVTPEAERIIAASCPGAVVAPWTGVAPEIHPYWGPWRRVLTGHATDETVRFEGSSGGAISGLLIHALETGLIDRVVHVAAAEGDPTRNATVVSRTAAEIVRRAGSRYTASSPLAGLEAELAAGGAFAVVGKPCDVSALRQLALRDPRVGRHVKVVLSFFCGGIPSHDGVRRILKTMGVAFEDVRAFRFRGRGWPGDCVAETDTGEGRMSYPDSWGGHLSKEVQFRCKICPDAVGGAADIACADAWYGDDDGYPAFDEQEGRSLIVSRTEAGERLLSAALGAGRLDAEPVPVNEIDAMQPSQARRKRLVLARTLALPLALQPRPRMAGLKVLEAARRAPLVEALRNFVGTLRRTMLGRRSRL